MLPFPWIKNPTTSANKKRLTSSGTSLKITHEPECGTPSRAKPHEHQEHFAHKSLCDLHEACQRLGSIVFKVPSFGATAGAALHHAFQQVEVLFQKQWPMIYKFGFTHDPIWRWSNKMYGYCHARDSWSRMVLLFISKEAGAAGMMEAALIEKYHGCLT